MSTRYPILQNVAVWVDCFPNLAWIIFKRRRCFFWTKLNQNSKLPFFLKKSRQFFFTREKRTVFFIYDVGQKAIFLWKSCYCASKGINGCDKWLRFHAQKNVIPKKSICYSHLRLNIFKIVEFYAKFQPTSFLETAPSIHPKIVYKL